MPSNAYQMKIKILPYILRIDDNIHYILLKITYFSKIGLYFIFINVNIDIILVKFKEFIFLYGKPNNLYTGNGKESCNEVFN